MGFPIHQEYLEVLVLVLWELELVAKLDILQELE